MVDAQAVIPNDALSLLAIMLPSFRTSHEGEQHADDLSQNPSELETLRNVSLRCTALDRALLLTSDGSGFLQVVGQVGDTTHELVMIAGSRGAFCNEVRDSAAGWEQGIGHPRITAINNNGCTQIRIRTIILVIRNNGPLKS